MSREPVMWANAVAGIVAAIVSVGLLTTGQAAVVNNMVTAAIPIVAFLLPLLAGFIARARVRPVATPDPKPARRADLRERF
jgi:choline-glycine betaine transporter